MTERRALYSATSQTMRAAMLVWPAACLVAASPVLWATPLLVFALMSGRNAPATGNQP